WAPGVRGKRFPTSQLAISHSELRIYRGCPTCPLIRLVVFGVARSHFIQLWIHHHAAIGTFRMFCFRGIADKHFAPRTASLVTASPGCRSGAYFSPVGPPSPHGLKTLTRFCTSATIRSCFTRFSQLPLSFHVRNQPPSTS